jgi:hypothetical protein
MDEQYFSTVVTLAWCQRQLKGTYIRPNCILQMDLPVLSRKCEPGPFFLSSREHSSLERE